jgi:hypothetical protein
MGLAAIQRESGRGKSQKTYFLKNITFFFVSLKNSCNFAAETNKI